MDVYDPTIQDKFAINLINKLPILVYLLLRSYSFNSKCIITDRKNILMMGFTEIAGLTIGLKEITHSPCYMQLFKDFSLFGTSQAYVVCLHTSLDILNQVCICWMRLINILVLDVD